MIEIALVITIMAVLIGLASTYYSNLQIKADINSQASNIAHSLRLASSSAASGLNDNDHGIHFENSSYTIFEGNVYDSEDPSNFEIDLPESMRINSISLNEGGSNVIFSKIDGETPNYGAVSLNSPAINRTITIIINQNGTINY